MFKDVLKSQAHRILRSIAVVLKAKYTDRLHELEDIVQKMIDGTRSRIPFSKKDWIEALTLAGVEKKSFSRHMKTISKDFVEIVPFAKMLRGVVFEGQGNLPLLILYFINEKCFRESIGRLIAERPDFLDHDMCYFIEMSPLELLFMQLIRTHSTHPAINLGVSMKVTEVSMFF